MLRALSVDSRAGLYLTTFCEQSGNKVRQFIHHHNDVSMSDVSAVDCFPLAVGERCLLLD